MLIHFASCGRCMHQPLPPGALERKVSVYEYRNFFSVMCDAGYTHVRGPYHEVDMGHREVRASFLQLLLAHVLRSVDVRIGFAECKMAGSVLIEECVHEEYPRVGDWRI